MKLTISILIAMLVIYYAPECLGSGPAIKIIIKGNVQVLSRHNKSFICTPAENANIFLFFHQNEYTTSEVENNTVSYSTDKNGDFIATVYYVWHGKMPCYYTRNGKYILEQEKCIEIPNRIEIIATYPSGRRDENRKYRGIRSIYNTADLDMTQDKEGWLIFNIPVIEMKRKGIEYHCDD